MIDVPRETIRALMDHLWLIQFPHAIGGCCGPSANRHCLDSQERLAREVLRQMEWVRHQYEPYQLTGQPPLTLAPPDWLP